MAPNRTNTGANQRKPRARTPALTRTTHGPLKNEYSLTIGDPKWAPHRSYWCSEKPITGVGCCADVRRVAPYERRLSGAFVAPDSPSATGITRTRTLKVPSAVEVKLMTNRGGGELVHITGEGRGLGEDSCGGLYPVSSSRTQVRVRRILIRRSSGSRS